MVLSHKGPSRHIEEATAKLRPSGQGKSRPMKLRSESFVHRFLQHVLPTGLQKVRHFGFMHKRSKWKPTWLSMLVTVSLSLANVLIAGLSIPVGN